MGGKKQSEVVINLNPKFSDGIIAILRMSAQLRWLLIPLFLWIIHVESSDQFSIDGTVLELDQSNFDTVITSLEFVFVDFYAPWCGHCKRLSPELDAAAPVLAGLKEPIVVAKVNADKFKLLSKKYNIDGFPTLKLFIHGVPISYDGPRKADPLIRYLRKFVAPDVTILDSDAAVSGFIDGAGTSFPIFILFGLSESSILNSAMKFKKKAWFSIANGFTEDAMVLYDFDKIPALVSLHPAYNEHHIFYGPFEDVFLEEFVRQNLLPTLVPMNPETLKLLGDDDRKIVLTIFVDENAPGSAGPKQLLKATASSNRDLIFAYSGAKQWPEFADGFGVRKKTASELPKMIVWDGNDEYASVTGVERLEGNDFGSVITAFIEGYREGRMVWKKVDGPSLAGFFNSLVNIRTLYLLIFISAVLFLIQTIGHGDGSDEQPPATPKED